MTSKKLFSSSVLFFIGAVLSLATTLVLREFSAYAFVVIDFLPEIALGIFLFSLSKSAELSFVNKARKILSVIFVICLANVVFQLIADIVFMVMIETSGDHEALFRFFVLSSYLKILPFARILSDIPALLRGFLNPFFAVSLLGDALVLAGFIRVLALLRLEAKQYENESVSAQGNALSEISENLDSPKMMGFGEAVKTCFKKYFSFRGCATRAEYWWFQLFVGGISFALLAPAFIALKNFNYTVYVIFMSLDLVFTVATLLPAFSVGVRRMHDTGNWGFLIVIPIVNIIHLCLPSVESNEYRSEYNIHPTANFLGKIVVVASLAIYVVYMGAILSTVFVFVLTFA